LRKLADSNLWIALSKTPLRIVVGLGILFPVTAWAQGAPAARDFMNTPVNAGAIYGDFLYNSAETASSSNLPVPNNETVSRVRAVTYLWSFPMAGRYAGVAVSEAYTSVTSKGPGGEITGSGFTDPGFTLHANIFGAPALRKDEIANAIPTTASSFHLTVNPPLGSYDRNSPINAGANRWAFNPMVHLSITRDEGVSWIDLYGGVRLFTNNNEYQGSKQLSQKPLVNFAVHYSHNIGKKMYAAGGVYYDYGGETSVNHVPTGNISNGFRPGFSFSRVVWRLRLVLRYELTASTPMALPTNSVLAFRVVTALP
jgi:hypothetical protein